MSAEPVRYRFNKAVDPAGLRDELLAAGIAVSLVNPVNGAVDIDIPAADYDRAAAIVAAHVKATYDQAAADRAQQDDTDLTRVRAAYQNLKADAAALRNDADTMPATLTLAQVRPRLVQIERALAETNETLAALVRYLARRLS